MKAKMCLIIESDKYLSESISSRLEEIGFNTEILFSTKESLELEAQKYSLVILSLAFQNEDSFLPSIKKFKNSTIILLTSYIDHSSIIEAMNNGANDFLLKPFVMEMLLQKIDVFQKIKDLKRKERGFRNFLDEVLTPKYRENFNFNFDIELPAFLHSKSERNIDSFVYFYSKHHNKYIEVVQIENLAKYSFKNELYIYYIRNFSTLVKNEQQKLLEAIQGKTVLIGVEVPIEQNGFRNIKVERLENFVEMNEILTVSDYIRNIIIQNQNRISDTDLAKALGISRKSLWEKRRKFDIQKHRKH